MNRPPKIPDDLVGDIAMLLRMIDFRRDKVGSFMFTRENLALESLAEILAEDHPDDFAKAERLNKDRLEFHATKAERDARFATQRERDQP